MLKTYSLVLVVVLMVGCERTSDQQNVKQAESTPAAIIPPLEILGQGARAPTLAELAQDAQFNAQQIALAKQRLDSKDLQLRLRGAEQLSAYPSPESEQILRVTLLQADVAQLRQTAARSLALFKQLSDATIDALVVSLSDKDVETRMAVFAALTGVVWMLQSEPERQQALLLKLQRRSLKSKLPRDVQQSLLALLADNQVLTAKTSQLR